MKYNEIKEEIKKTYGDIAKGNVQVGCCSTESACCTTDEFSTSMAEAYTNVEGYNQAADLSLGCGLPTEIANIKENDIVIDLGSGAGNDAFVARKIVGEKGKVIGIDMTPEMVIRALQNNQKLGFKNVEFQLSEIENMRGIPDNTADVVISNCVMNLVPNKVKAFAEVFRVLKTGAHFSISDIVTVGSLPEKIVNSLELIIGCVSGAIEKGDYLGIIKAAGFKNIQIKKERPIKLADELLLNYLNESELEIFKQSKAGIYSITVYAEKLEEGACCESTGNNCCGSEVETPVEEKQSTCCDTSSGSSNCC